MKNKKTKFTKKTGAIAIIEIALLMIGIISFSYVLGNSFSVVSAQAGEQCVNAGGQTWRIEGNYVVSISTSEKIRINPDFCNDNGIGGRAGVCTGSPFRLKEDKKYLCPQGEADPSPGQAISTLTSGFSLARGYLRLLKKSQETSAPPVITKSKTSFWKYFSTKPALKDAEGKIIGAGGVKHWLGYIASNAVVAYGVSQLIKLGAKHLLKLDPELAKSIGAGAGWGYFAGAMVAKIGTALKLKGIFSSTWLFGLPTLGWIGIGIGILISIFTHKKTRMDVVSFSCMPWDAVTKGQDCEVCNRDDIPCTEYRCKSLGQACEIINPGTDNELCVWVDRDDINPPVIKPWEEILTSGYKYVPDTAISPPHKGVKIVPEDDINGCVAPFTPLVFGLALDKPAKCKISPERPTSFQDMGNLFMSNGLSLYNHSFQRSLPNSQTLGAENITFIGGGEFSLYIRCETKQGYSNSNDFLFRFCVDDGPDTEEPIITRTSILNNSPIANNQYEINLSIFVNEPSQCRWSRLDQSYDDMPDENQVNCPASKSVLDTSLAGDYKCEASTLTGLLNNQNNDFYFRCKDQIHLEGTDEEHLRNINEKSYFFRLIGTQPLNIDSAEPNEVTIKNATFQIKVDLEVETSVGYDKGAATCSFSPAGQNRFVLFFNTGTHKHSQRLDLTAGTYTYEIRCVDLGGNADTREISFTVETDMAWPVVVRVFRDGQNLKIITDEEATCVYDNKNCLYAFEDGLKMTSDGKVHFTEWEPDKNFYIKCQDEFGNQPPQGCSMTVRPFEI